MSEPERQTDLVALRNPLWWGALVLLVLNDQWLKGADLMPAWLTGKLSDVAGLIVAPVLVSALLMASSRRCHLRRSHLRRRRALAFVIVGGWFTAANLFAPVALATSHAAAWVGLQWSFWVDPTDLVALAVLPLAWHIASHRRAHRPVAVAARVAEKLALGFGLAACIASPQPPDPGWNANAFVYNGSDRPLEIRVRWLDASVDCDMIRGRYTDVLARDAFGPGTVFNIAAGATLPLDRGVADPDMPLDPWDPPPTVETGHVGTCDVIIISTRGLPETMVFWEGLSPSFIPEVVEDEEDERAVESGLHLLPAGDDDAEALLLSPPGRGYFIDTPLDVYDGGGACHDYGTITGFDWSDFPEWSDEDVRLVEVRPTIDGCVQVTIEASDGFGEREMFEGFICVPPGDFPFLPNSEVRIWNGPRQLRIVRDLRLDDGSVWRTGELVIVRGVDSFDEGPFRLRLTDVDAACMGVREACGGFRIPAAGGLTMGSSTRFVHPGEAVERDAADGRRARLRVGRAERMWVTHPACGAGRDELGPRLEALVMYGEEPR